MVLVVDFQDHFLSIVVIADHYLMVVVEPTSIVAVQKTSMLLELVTNTVFEMKDASLIVDENFPAMLNSYPDWD